MPEELWQDLLLDIRGLNTFSASTLLDDLEDDLLHLFIR